MILVFGAIDWTMSNLRKLLGSAGFCHDLGCFLKTDRFTLCDVLFIFIIAPLALN